MRTSKKPSCLSGGVLQHSGGPVRPPTAPRFFRLKERPHAFRAAKVAQISNLLCRRLSAFAARHSAASARRRPVGRYWNFEALADSKSAIRQTRSLRYGAAQLNLDLT